MIHTRLLSADVSSVTAQLVGEDVAVLAFVCSSQDAAKRLLDGFERRLKRVSARMKARTPVAPATAADLFRPGEPARLSVFDWDKGEHAIDVTIIRRVSPQRWLVRTRMGRVTEVDQRDLERGRRAG